MKVFISNVLSDPGSHNFDPSDSTSTSTSAGGVYPELSTVKDDYVGSILTRDGKIDISKLSPPVRKKIPITQVYGRSSVRGIHKGVDYGTPEGTELYPVARGKVIKAGSKPGRSKGGYSHEGLFVVVSHGSGVVSHYYHMNEILVKAGDIVSTNTVIGLSGDTGNSTGPHLHLQLMINKTPQAFSAGSL